MQIIVQYIVPLIVGAVIGYITNEIAIRMLFRPHQKKYIGKIHIPFTPGIIPKEKERIAEAIGQAVSDNLMNKEVLEKSLLSEEMLQKVEESFDEFVAKQKDNEETVAQFATHYLREDEYEAIRSNATEELTNLVYKRIANTQIGDRVAEMAMQYMKQKSQDSFMGGVAGLFGADKIMEHIEGPVKKFVGKHINDILRENSKQILTDLIGKESDKLSVMPVKQLLENQEDKITEAKASLLSVYRSVISEHLPRILQTLDISKIIRDRINEMDMMEAEEIVLSVLNKELRAVVWLGALLGFVMGALNILARLIL